MMKNKIHNAVELRNEIVRLKNEMKEREANLKDNFSEVKESLRPENIALRSLSSITGVDFTKGNFFKSGILATISIIIHRFITKQESALEKKITSWAENIIDRLRDFQSGKND